MEEVAAGFFSAGSFVFEKSDKASFGWRPVRIFSRSGERDNIVI